MLGPTVALAAPSATVDALGAFVGAALRGALVLAVAAAAAAALRRRTAAERHAVWAAALSAHLALPALARLVPAYLPWTLPWTLPGVAAGPAGAGADTAAPMGSASVGRAIVVGIVWVWLAGAAVMLGKRLAGALALRRHVRHTHALSEAPWRGLREEAAAVLGVMRPIRLLQGGGLGVPVTWGILRPVILLPPAATGWDAARRRMVLLHETAHVARWDALTHLVAQAACVVFWWDPLVWMAARQLRDEGERAADDRVVRAGVAPSSYVADLVAFVRAHRSTHAPPGALAFVGGWARPHGPHGVFERRMRALLDPAIHREPLSRITAATAPAAALALASVLSLHAPGAAAPPAEAAPPGDGVLATLGVAQRAVALEPSVRSGGTLPARRRAHARVVTAPGSQVEAPPTPLVRTPPPPSVPTPPEPLVPTPRTPPVGAPTSGAGR